jgi:hypothetical protein
LKKRAKSNIKDKIQNCLSALKEIAQVSGSEKINSTNKQKFLSFDLFVKNTSKEQQESLLENGWSNVLKDIYTNEWLLSDAKIKRIEKQYKVTLESIYSMLDNNGAEPDEDEAVDKTIVPIQEQPEWNDHDQNK